MHIENVPREYDTLHGMGEGQIWANVQPKANEFRTNFLRI